jgi:hypothetical protein
MKQPTSLQVQSVHIVTDRPLGDAQARTLSRALAGRIQGALAEAQGAVARVRIGELRIALPGDALHDRDALERCARGVAQRILDR